MYIKFVWITTQPQGQKSIKRSKMSQQLIKKSRSQGKSQMSQQNSKTLRKSIKVTGKVKMLPRVTKKRPKVKEKSKSN